MPDKTSPFMLIVVASEGHHGWTGNNDIFLFAAGVVHDVDGMVRHVSRQVTELM